MPDIDPAALSRADHALNGLSQSPGSGKALTIAVPALSRTARSTQPYPRVDIEPLYTQLKDAVGEHWTTYKEGISRFVIGFISLEELSRQIDAFILCDAHIINLHNQLICALHTNLCRDLPDTSVATWVSANDKPSTSSKPLPGDEGEQRLKAEVMKLPPRVRQRLKNIQDDPHTPLTHTLVHHHHQKRSWQTSAQTGTNPASTPLMSHAPSSASTGLSKDFEIRRRYNAALISETRDVLGAHAISERLLPIAYEEGLLSGSGNTSGCADLLTIALETFVKEELGVLLGRTRADAPVSDPVHATADVQAPGTNGAPVGPISKTGATIGSDMSKMNGSAGGIMTAAYKARLTREERAATSGQLKRTDAGFLPIEVASAKASSQGAGMSGDLRIAWELGEPWLNGLAPWLGERLVGTVFEGADMPEWFGQEDVDVIMSDGIRNNSITGTMPNGASGEYLDQMVMDEADWGWQGGGNEDRMMLGSLLDECLAVGQ